MLIPHTLLNTVTKITRSGFLRSTLHHPQSVSRANRMIHVVHLLELVLWNERIKNLDDGILFECLVVADLSDNGNGCTLFKSFQTFHKDAILETTGHSIVCCWAQIIQRQPSLFHHPMSAYSSLIHPTHMNLTEQWRILCNSCFCSSSGNARR